MHAEQWNTSRLPPFALDGPPESLLTDAYRAVSP